MKMFLIIGSEGAYDDYAEWPVVVGADKAKVEAHIDELTKLQSHRHLKNRVRYEIQEVEVLE